MSYFLTDHELSKMSKPELERMVKILHGLLESKLASPEPSLDFPIFKITRERKSTVRPRMMK